VVVRIGDGVLSVVAEAVAGKMARGEAVVRITTKEAPAVLLGMEWKQIMPVITSTMFLGMVFSALVREGRGLAVEIGSTKATITEVMGVAILGMAVTITIIAFHRIILQCLGMVMGVVGMLLPLPVSQMLSSGW
jgi:hypothetical protein